MDERIEELEEEEKEFETASEGEDSDVPFDLERGEPIRFDSYYDKNSLPWKAGIETAKEFFNTEILYRYDILDPSERSKLAGVYAVSVVGDKGGVWTVKLGDDLEIFSEVSKEVETTLSVSQRDFLQLVNGDLNPQLALLAGKISVSGLLEKIEPIQILLCPRGV